MKERKRDRQREREREREVEREGEREIQGCFVWCSLPCALLNKTSRMEKSSSFIFYLRPDASKLPDSLFNELTSFFT